MEYNNLLGQLLIDQQVLDISDGSKEHLMFAGIIMAIKDAGKNVVFYCTENRVFSNYDGVDYKCIISKEEVNKLVNTGRPVWFDTECKVKTDEIHVCKVHHFLQIIQVNPEIRDIKLEILGKDKKSDIDYLMNKDSSL